MTADDGRTEDRYLDMDAEIQAAMQLLRTIASVTTRWVEYEDETNEVAPSLDDLPGVAPAPRLPTNIIQS
jgi:hypothetical protein